MTHHTLMYCAVSFPLPVMPYHVMSRYAMPHCTLLYYTTVMFVLFIVRFSYFMLLYLVILSINRSLNYTALGLLSSCDSYSFQPSPPPFRSSLHSFSSFLPSSNPPILYILHLTHNTQHSIQHKTSSNPTTLSTA